MKILLFFLLAMLPCYANIGETPEQSIQRYGTPVISKDESLNVPFSKWAGFDHAPFSIIVYFYKDKCVSVEFRKRDVNSDGTLDLSDRPLSDEEIKALMKENSDGKIWGLPTTVLGVITWTRSDGIICAYDKDAYWLLFRKPSSSTPDKSASQP